VFLDLFGIEFHFTQLLCVWVVHQGSYQGSWCRW